MRRYVWAALVALPLVVGGLAYAAVQSQSSKLAPVETEGYICPLTGEDLPCPNCCPLSHE